MLHIKSHFDSRNHFVWGILGFADKQTEAEWYPKAPLVEKDRIQV